MANTSKQSRGGMARKDALTPEQRSEIASKAADARWGKQAICEGPVDIGNATLNAAVLDGGIRVLSQADFLRSIGRSRSPKAGTGILSSVDELPFFLRANALQPFINNDLKESTAPIFYRTLTGTKQVGYRHDLLPKVCEVYLAFRDDALSRTGKIPKQFQHIIEACDLLMRALAHVGI
ncbi:MAG: P63C domain-containing protein, partial [Woeseiaceae bacterium]